MPCNEVGAASVSGVAGSMRQAHPFCLFYERPTRGVSQNKLESVGGRGGGEEEGRSGKEGMGGKMKEGKRGS